ncbi:alpha/beta fold hydrolase [Microseira wollei]|uniref:Hydrolase, alpha/beta hydrolase fold family protein n=1 Tax=Microseira wollei NIES-4236 TaxID=2530354 RepID=A0AAV3WEP6_9CYAN|nr:alpha/beta hydrolase [Microseira wollei]GET35829.1 hydrolase, alpha/beta hydrolase fold family protein [Microseira wollei NIES-4236]
MKRVNQVTTEQIVEQDGCLLHYWLTGSEDKPLIIFTHGAGVDHHEFDAQVPFIAQEYRVLTWDVRGHGLSQLRGKEFTIRDAINDLLTMLERLGCSQATFVGHSMGGNIHQELVFYYPNSIRALVMLGCTCNTLKLSQLEMLQTQIAISLLKFYPWNLLKHQMVQVSAISAEARAYLNRAFEQISKHNFIAVMTELTKVLHYEPGYHITQPLLLTHGDNDMTGNIKKIASVWATREPNCRYQVIPKAGHAANLDNSKFFNSLLLDFLHEYVPVTVTGKLPPWG